VLVAGSSDADRGARADRLARFFRVPHISVGEVLRDHAVPGGGDAPGLRVIAARLGDSPGYIIDSDPRTLAEAAAFDGLLASLTVPADLVVHLRSDKPTTDSVVGYYQARGTLAEFPPDTDDETIVASVRRAVFDRTARAMRP
jgi:adenylate kinase family enzyme